MRIKNKIISSFFKFGIFLMAFLGITMFCGIYEHEYNFEILLYYTMITNCLCMLYFGIDFVYVLIKNKNIFPKLKGIITFGITITGLVFFIMLSKTNFDMGVRYHMGNIFLHYLVPLCSVLDWLLFDEKGTYKNSDLLRWLLLPVIYFIFVITIVSLGYEFSSKNRFPYFFINLDKYGLGIWKYTLGILLGGLLIGYLFILIDKKLDRTKKVNSK